MNWKAALEHLFLSPLYLLFIVIICGGIAMVVFLAAALFSFIFLSGWTNFLVCLAAFWIWSIVVYLIIKAEEL